MNTKPLFILISNISILLAATSLRAQNPQTNITQLPAVVVTATAPGYAVSDSTTATKLDVPIKDLPASIQVVPRQLLLDRGVMRLDQYFAHSLLRIARRLRHQ